MTPNVNYLAQTICDIFPKDLAKNGITIIIYFLLDHTHFC